MGREWVARRVSAHVSVVVGRALKVMMMARELFGP